MLAGRRRECLPQSGVGIAVDVTEHVPVHFNGSGSRWHAATSTRSGRGRGDFVLHFFNVLNGRFLSIEF